MDENTRLEQLEKEFVQGWISRDPILATACGRHEFDDSLPVPGVEGIEDMIRFLRTSRKQFEKIRLEDLPPRRRIDAKLALHLIREKLAELEEFRLWERVPNVPFFLGDSIYQLLGRNYAPLSQRLLAVLARLEKLPEYIRGALSRIRVPIRLYLENEIETVSRLAGFFFLIRDLAKENLPRALLKKMNAAIERTQDALDEFCNNLVIDILPEAKDEHAIDPERYQKWLRVKGVAEGIPEVLETAGKDYFSKDRTVRDLAREIRRKSEPEDVRDAIRDRHPSSFNDTLEYLQGAVQEARKFVAGSDLWPRFTEGTLFVVEMPSYMRSVRPMHAYWPPGRFEKSQESYLFFIPSDCDSSRLREYNYPAMQMYAQALAYPGVHLLYTMANDHPSVLRALASDVQTRSGWAWHASRAATAMGLQDSPELRFVQAARRETLAARAVVDVRLSTGSFKTREAVAYLVHRSAMDWVVAEAEIRRILVEPGRAVAAFYGVLRMEELHAEVKRRLRRRFTERFFNETVLGAGPVPMPFLKEEFELRIEAATGSERRARSAAAR